MKCPARGPFSKTALFVHDPYVAGLADFREKI